MDMKEFDLHRIDAPITWAEQALKAAIESHEINKKSFAWLTSLNDNMMYVYYIDTSTASKMVDGVCQIFKYPVLTLCPNKEENVLQCVRWFNKNMKLFFKREFDQSNGMFVFRSDDDVPEKLLKEIGVEKLQIKIHSKKVPGCRIRSHKETITRFRSSCEKKKRK